MPIFNPNVGGSGTPGTSTINVDFIPLTIPTTNTKWTTICNNKMSDSGNFKLVSATLDSSTYWVQYGNESGNSKEITKVFRVVPQNGHTIVALYDSIHSPIRGSQTSSGSTWRWVMLSAAQNHTLLITEADSYAEFPLWLRGNIFPSDCICFAGGASTNGAITTLQTNTDYYALVKSFDQFTQVYGIFVYYR